MRVADVCAHLVCGLELLRAAGFNAHVRGALRVPPGGATSAFARVRLVILLLLVGGPALQATEAVLVIPRPELLV